MPQRGKSVFPIDLFPLQARSGVIGNRNFVDAGARFSDVGCQLHFNAESAGRQVHGFHQIRAQDLVAGFHVGQIKSGQQITQGR